MFAFMGSFRSEIQNKVREHAGSLLSEYDQLTKQDIEKIKDNEYRSNCPRFKELLGFNPCPTEDEPEYPLIPPILSRGGTGRIEDLFRNKIHYKVRLINSPVHF